MMHRKPFLKNSEILKSDFPMTETIGASEVCTAFILINIVVDLAKKSLLKKHNYPNFE